MTTKPQEKTLPDKLGKVVVALKTLNSLFLELNIAEPDKYVYEYLYNLYVLVSTLKPKQIFECGTGPKGIGTRAMLTGLIFNGEGGHITTVEIVDNERMKGFHRELQNKIGLMGGEGMVQFVYGDDLQVEVPQKIDLVYLDTNHTYNHTVAELLKFSEAAGVIVCHDTKVVSDVPEAVQKAINTFLQTHPEWTCVEVGASPYGLGILIKEPKQT